MSKCIPGCGAEFSITFVVHTCNSSSVGDKMCGHTPYICL